MDIPIFETLRPTQLTRKSGGLKTLVLVEWAGSAC